ncbi:unnamed protein product [Schistosoma rodhaini]|uniref:Coiled-coil domain-containing protein 146 n=1 Tax=Schistosoma rodhaini TaxID=6188 RepID=A0AA85FTI3_9TREM|nr:unnamed protein product [Schistosoma rodhaini]
MSYENDPKHSTEELPSKPNDETDDGFLIARPNLVHEPLVASDETESNQADHNKDIKDDSSPGGFFSAIDSVEKLGYEGKLSSVQIAQMKHRFFKLSGLLSKIRDNEFNLIQLSKKMSIQLDSLNESLSKADNYPEGYNTKADKLREQLLNANNRLLQIEERNEELNYTIESLKDEKRMLENEYNRMPKEEDVINQRKQLEKSVSEVKSEINKRSGETRQLTQTLQDTKEMLGQVTKLKNDVEEQCQNLVSESAEIQSQLLQTMKETDKLQKQKDEVERLKTETSDEQLKLQDEMKTLESLRLQLELESVKLQNQSTKKQKKLCDLQAQHEAVNIHVSELEQKNAEMTLQKTETDLKMDYLKQELLQLKDRINHQTRLHEAFIRKTRKADNILQALKESVKFTMKTCSEKHMNCLAMKQTGQDTQLLKKRTQLINDIKKLKEMLISQCQLTELEQTKLRQSLQQVDQMNYDLANLRIELVELTRLVTIKSDEREQKSREFLIAQSRYNRIQDDIKSKQLQINEYDKSLNSTQKKLKDFAHLYETVKEERNNCLNSIQLSNQHIQELGEKLRISANEIDILKNNLDHKEELLNKQRKNIEKVTVARDHLRNEFSKLSCTIKDNEAQKERMEQSIHRQNTIITQTTKQLEDLKNAIGHVIKLRDSRAIEIVERNEEFCVLQEKLNLQNFTLHKGEIEMNKLEDEIKSLQLIKNDIKRKNELLKKESEKSKKLKNEVQSSQLQLAVYQDRLAKLEKTAISPKAFLLDSETGDAIQKDLIKCKNHKNINIIIYETRLNELNGKNENIAELKYKIDTLEIQIYSREKKLLELNLLLDAIQCLINKLEKQVNMGKDVALTLAVKTNEQKGTTVQTTKLLKATTAELTMLMTTAFDLEQQVKERRTFLKECYERIEAGNPPTDDVIEELEKYSKVIQWKSDRKRISKALELNDYWTTAPERPNAYLIHRDVSKKSYEYPPNTAPNHGGSDDQVSSPKTNSVLIPYGAHAPFRPNDPSSHMRHFRKPELKPVDT